MDSKPILYSFRRCPYAMRARMAIMASGTQVELREVVLRNKPEEMVAVSPKATVPVLIDQNGTVVDQSLDIMLWALGKNDPNGWVPENVRNEMLDFIEELDGPFKHHLDSYKYSTRYAGDEDQKAFKYRHRRSALDILEGINEKLAGQKYLFGKQPTLGDFATFPFVRQFANTDRDWFDRQNIPNIQRWLEDLTSSELFLDCMAKFDPWQTGTPGVSFPT